MIAIIVGAVIHEYVSRGTITQYLSGPIAVPTTVAIGAPIITNISRMIPFCANLIGKELPIGTSIVLMMSVTTLSLPHS